MYKLHDHGSGMRISASMVRERSLSYIGAIYNLYYSKTSTVQNRTMHVVTYLLYYVFLMNFKFIKEKDRY